VWRETCGRLAAWGSQSAPLLALLCLAAVFRFPVLLDAGAVNSDAAVVGLQAMHLLRGEWAWTLWGAAYQAPVDSIVAALAFVVLGASPLALLLVPFVGQLIVVGLFFGISRKNFAPWAAAWLTLPVVFTPMAVNLCLIYVQRQFCIVLFATSLWLLAGSQGSPRASLRLFLGSCAAVFTLYLDLYAIQWIGPLVLLALACAFTKPLTSRPTVHRVASAGLGLLLGWIVVRVLRGFCPQATGTTSVSFSIDRLSSNLHLLTRQSLPWTLSYEIFAHRGGLYAEAVPVPRWFRVIQDVGAGLVAVATVSAAGLVWMRRIPWGIRRLALFALATMGCSLAGFLVSGMPVDMWSTRYLAPIILTMPLALGPTAFLLGTRRFAALATPYLVAAAVNGWISYGVTYVEAGLPVRSARGAAREELDVGRLLREHHVAYGAAQYWLAYRLTFLFQENPTVVPLNPSDDRYPAYRRGFEAARDVAYIFHPSEPRASPNDAEWQLKRSGARYERFKVADFTVFIEHRR
jgi:hypothetical protein